MEEIHVLDKMYGTDISIEDVLNEISAIRVSLKRIAIEYCKDMFTQAIEYPVLDSDGLEGEELTDFHLHHHLEIIRLAKEDELSSSTEDTKCIRWAVEKDILNEWLYKYAATHWINKPTKLIYLLDTASELSLPIFYFDILFQLIDTDNFKIRDFDVETEIHIIGYSRNDRALLISKLGLLKEIYKHYYDLDDDAIEKRMHVFESFINEGPTLLVYTRLPMEIKLTQFEPN
jgi:DNA-binding FrmR family transcriptional regulator